MAVSRELVINSIDSTDEVVKTTIKNINPSADVTNVMLKTAAMTLNNLTTNTLVSIHVINEEDITTAT